MSKQIIIVDGSSYLFRYFYALPMVLNGEGIPTNAIFGIDSMIRKISTKYRTEYLVIVFDHKGKNFRHEIYKDYKSNRTSMPEDLIKQIAPIYQLINILGLKLISLEGVEADDTIGTLAKKFSQKGHEIVIFTIDKDMSQLVNKKVKLTDIKNQELVDEESVKKKFGVYPKQIVDYLTLVGDASDNIPGIRGIGPKTTIKLLSKYFSIEEILSNLKEIDTKTAGMLSKSVDLIDVMKNLTTIRCDLDLNCSLEDLKCKRTNVVELDIFYRKYNII